MWNKWKILEGWKHWKYLKDSTDEIDMKDFKDQIYETYFEDTKEKLLVRLYKKHAIVWTL